MITLSLFRWLWAAFLVLVAPFGAFGAEKPTPANDLAITMSPYEVSANSVDFKRWIKVSSPNYIIYTDTDLKEATELIRELEMGHRAMQVFFRRRAMNLPPVVVVLPTSGSDWKKIQSKGSVEWTVAVSSTGTQFVKAILVQYDWQNQGLWIVRASQARMLFEAMNLDGPFWFGRGVAKFMETAEFKGDTVLLGKQNSRSRHVIADGWLDWPKFFGVTSKSKEFVDRYEIHRYEGQASVFIQYMLAHPEPVWTDRVVEWASLLEAGREPTEAEFSRVFGMGYKAWQKTMDSYMRSGKYFVRSVRIPPEYMNFAPVKIDLPTREMRELFVLCQILNQDIPASTESLDAVLKRGLKVESLREFLAEACLKRKRPEAAAEVVKMLHMGGSQNPAVYMHLGAGILAKKGPKPSLDARLTASEVAEIKQLADKALALEPRYIPAANLLAWAEALAPTVDAEAVKRIEGRYREQVDYVATSEVLSALAVACLRAGQKDAARLVCETLLTSPFAEKEAREIATQVQSALASGQVAP